MRSALQEALEHLERALVATFQKPPARIKVYLSGDEKPTLNLALSPKVYFGERDLTGEIEQSEDKQQTGKISPCVVDILDVLRAAKRPLTTMGILEALSREGKEWSPSYVGKHLAEMVKDGILTNPKNGKPPGYRLAEWETTYVEGPNN